MPNEDLIREIVAKACSEALQEIAGARREYRPQARGSALGSHPRQRERTKELRDGALLSRLQDADRDPGNIARGNFGDRSWLRLVSGARNAGNRLELSWPDNGWTPSSGPVWTARGEWRRGDQLLLGRGRAGFRTRSGLRLSGGTGELGQILLVPVLLKGGSRPADRCLPAK